MRCPECHHSQKSRVGARCQKCHYQFVFYQKQEPIRDFTLRQVVRRVSDDGEYAFTATQLALEICRVWRAQRWRALGCGLVIALTGGTILSGMFVTWGGNWLGGVLIPIGLIWLAIRWNRRQRAILPIAKAYQVIERYHLVHPLTGLADGQAFRHLPPQVDCQEPRYAPERILVMERDEWVDLLVRNGFHLTAKAAIVSRTGYPERIFMACQEFLHVHPSTPVQVVHDASLPGFALPARLAEESRWAFVKGRLVDLGIAREALNEALPLPWLPIDPHQGEGFLGGVPSKRLQAGYRVPVDCSVPKLLINSLNTAIASGTPLRVSTLENVFSMEVEYDYG